MGSVKSEDTVEYWIYTCNELTLNELLSFILTYSRNYLWNNECFRLAERDYPCRHFYGSTNYGDNADDEWFIVYLLMQLTIKYSDVVVRTIDTDGDFLLIEAANFLPRWITPATVDNRVFLHNGAVHVIPRKKDAPSYDLPETIGSPEEGVEIVRRWPHVTVADSSLHLCIERKVGSLTDNLNENLHNAYCYLPSKLAAVIGECPNLVAPAVQAFYLRDQKDLKACRECKYFPHEELVLQRVKFTKHLYAMLVQQDFFPDKRSVWQFPLPSESSYKQHKTGFKLTCGFEILCSRADSSASKSDFVESDPNWIKFVESLVNNGYFQGQLKHSRAYNELTKDAKNFYLEHIATSCKDQNYGALILNLLQKVNVNFEMLQNESQTLLPEDDDSWLTVTPEMLDAVLGDKIDFVDKNGSENGSSSNGHKSACGSRSINSFKQSMQDKVSTFMQGQGSFDGAKLTSKCTKQKVSVDCSSFETSLKHMLDFDIHIPESSSDSSDMDDSYGDESNDDANINAEDVTEIEKSLSEMKQYMNEMDKELVGSSVTKSFPLKKPPPVATKSVSSDVRSKSKSPGANSIDLVDDDFTPIDIDKTVVKNMLQSCWSEAGSTGPASVLLHGLNVLPSQIRHATLDSDDDDI